MKFSIERDLKKICEVLISDYFDIVWELFGEKINNDLLCFMRLRNILGQQNGNWDVEVGILFKEDKNYDKLIEWCKTNEVLSMALLVPISIEKNKKISWHPFTEKFISNFGNDIKVLNTISSNMSSYGISGSVVPYYEKQKELLLQLKEHELKLVRKWSKDMRKEIDKLIKIETLREENRKVMI